MKKKVLEAIRMNHPGAMYILMCACKFGKRYYIVDEEFNKADITEELHYVCRMLALEEILRRINENALV